jgi:predicted O-methyltransferase YrrM
MLQLHLKENKMSHDWGNKRNFKQYEIYGWASSPRISQYIDFVKKIKNGKIIEIGVYGGASLLEICDMCEDNQNIIFGIDPWETNNYSNGNLLNENTSPTLNEFHHHMSKNRKMLEKIIKEEKYDKFVNLIVEKASEASKKFDDKTIDLIYIDGSHDYGSVFQDLQIWYSKIKRSGLIWGDDYNWEGVQLALHDFAKENKLSVTVLEDNGWVLNFNE